MYGKGKDKPRKIEPEVQIVAILKPMHARRSLFSTQLLVTNSIFQVVAPVRETCAQTLGSVLHYMTSESVSKVLGVLLTLQEQNLWQVRHGGHLGIKYVLALKKVSC